MNPAVNARQKQKFLAFTPDITPAPGTLQWGKLLHQETAPCRLNLNESRSAFDPPKDRSMEAQKRIRSEDGTTEKLLHGAFLLITFRGA
jgi:hypothetical protein